MAGQKSLYWQKKTLDAAFGNSTLPALTTLYIAFFTTAPTSATDSAVEVSGGSYARVAKTNNATNWPAATNGVAGAPSKKSNGTVILFPAPTANWGTVKGVGIFDSATIGGGNLIYWADGPASLLVSSGDTAPSIPIGQLVITEL